MEEAGEESGPWLNPGGDDTDSQEEVARRGPAPPVFQLSSSFWGKEGGAAGVRFIQQVLSLRERNESLEKQIS
ncbi:hypothetical protein GUJ93_ZPchr0012g21158 [Zizania palustris]|uniref:Uncharacterized protein n=1 Tax=Zizania palustris TaxID=103762 RepID=A0A8J5WKQ9_ZIZPA|nr:hypothetical protein GUJ93_ZPchr0012g21158 [Zizania palustris]